MDARYSRNLSLHKTHFFIGLAISLLFTALVAFQVFGFWTWQAKMVSSLLSFAGVPHRLFFSESQAKGPTFEILVESQPIPTAALIIVFAVLVAIIIILKIFPKIPSPIKTMAFVISMVTTLTLLWQVFVAPIFPSPLHWVTLDWSCSGVISLCLISLIYVPLLFTIKGSLKIKFFWLFVAIGFSVVWNIIRMALVTATLYYFGSSVFLLFHYLIGAFIDFVYIITFYSLALAHLSKFQINGVMNHTS